MSLRLAASTVVCMCSAVNQLSHRAVDQCLMGATCASQARSSVPLAPSIAIRVRVGFLPPAAGDAALAILVPASCKHESDRPMVSQPYMIAGTPALLAMTAVLTPSWLRAL